MPAQHWWDKGCRLNCPDTPISGARLSVVLFSSRLFLPACTLFLVGKMATHLSGGDWPALAAPSGCVQGVHGVPAQCLGRCARLRAAAPAGSWRMLAARQRPTRLPIRTQLVATRMWPLNYKSFTLGAARDRNSLFAGTCLFAPGERSKCACGVGTQSRMKMSHCERNEIQVCPQRENAAVFFIA